MFSNTEVIVTQIVLTQYIVASLSLSVISQRPIYRSLPIHQNSWFEFQKQKPFQDIISKVISAFAQNNGCSAEHGFYPCCTRSNQLFSFL